MAQQGWLMIQASHIQRKSTRDNSPGDGEHLVGEGRIVLENPGTHLLILEEDNWIADNFDATPKMSIDLSLGYSVRFVKTYSSHGNHIGAKMKICGWFDRNFCETITIKMSRDDAVNLRELMRCMNL